MPSSNMPDPDKIPDMSLDDDRGERRRPAVSPEMGSGFQPLPDAPKPASPAPPAPPRWNVGDDVLAPWEPMYLYAGTIKQLLPDEARGDQALIDFDDGGEGWVFVYSLVPLEYHPGQTVECRRKNGLVYERAGILEVVDGEAHVRFDAGGDEWTTFATLRLPCVENGPGAVATKFAPFQTPLEAPSSGFPRWLIWVGVFIVLTIVRMSCRQAL
ncbi:MAG: hypothetical protein HY289_12430 [Planctomycetes bacterium]|nr:hypothetical protein [Planctomycetota bacterium]